MNTRANYPKLAPEQYQALFAFEKSLAHVQLDRKIIDLVKIRASQMNGCLFCLDMHTKEARTHEERELRIHHLPLWRESELFTPKEKAALEWTELLTKPSHHGVSDREYSKMSENFTEKEIVDLTMVIAAINAWNRLGIAFRSTPGSLDKLMGINKIGLE